MRCFIMAAQNYCFILEGVKCNYLLAQNISPLVYGLMGVLPQPMVDKRFKDPGFLNEMVEEIRKGKSEALIKNDIILSIYSNDPIFTSLKFLTPRFLIERVLRLNLNYFGHFFPYGPDEPSSQLPAFQFKNSPERLVCAFTSDFDNKIEEECDSIVNELFDFDRITNLLSKDVEPYSSWNDKYSLLIIQSYGYYKKGIEEFKLVTKDCAKI